MDRYSKGARSWSVGLDDPADGPIARLLRQRRWGGLLMSLQVSRNDFDIFQTRAGVEQNHFLPRLKKTIRQQFAIRGQRGGTLRSGENPFVPRPLHQRPHDLIVTDSNRGAATLLQNMENDVVAIGPGHAEPGRER